MWMAPVGGIPEKTTLERMIRLRSMVRNARSSAQQREVIRSRGSRMLLRYEHSTRGDLGVRLAVRAKRRQVRAGRTVSLAGQHAADGSGDRRAGQDRSRPNVAGARAQALNREIGRAHV